MPINAYWDTPARECLIVEVMPPLEWDRLHLQIQDTQKLIAESEHVVDVIVLPLSAPLDTGVLAHFRKLVDQQPANTGHIIVVMDAPSTVQMFARRLASTLQQLYPRKSRITFVRTFDEARRLSAAQKPALV